MGFDWSAITVLEMANVLAGPSVGSFFAQLGARVIKVESANGDVTRTWKLATEDPNNDRPSYFSWINAGKESVVFDYSSDQDKSILQNIIAQSDLVISSFKPGDETKFGLSPQDIHAINPRAIVANISAYGKNDPRVGYDALLQAESGFMYINGNSTADFHKMPVALIDVLAGHQLIQKTLLAFLDRTTHSMGNTVEVSLWEVALQSLTNHDSYLDIPVLMMLRTKGRPNEIKKPNLPWKSNGAIPGFRGIIPTSIHQLLEYLLDHRLRPPNGTVLSLRKKADECTPERSQENRKHFLLRVPRRDLLSCFHNRR